MAFPYTRLVNTLTSNLNVLVVENTDDDAIVKTEPEFKKGHLSIVILMERRYCKLKNIGSHHNMSASTISQWQGT